MSFTAPWTTRSLMVGIPSRRVLPFPFGISTPWFFEGLYVRKRSSSRIALRNFSTPPGLDGLKTLSIDPWRSVVGLRRLIPRSERLRFTHMNVETQKPHRLLGFRLTVYPSPQFLQINGRFYHASPASPCGRRNQTQHGPFAPSALPDFTAPTGHSAILLPSTPFPCQRL